MVHTINGASHTASQQASLPSRPYGSRRRHRRAHPSPSHFHPLQHSPAYTIGKRGSEADFLAGTAAALAAGAEVVPVPRGGETTYHGPGQLIAYPILNLRQLRMGARAYVEALEDIMIATAGRYGVSARVRSRNVYFSSLPGRGLPFPPARPLLTPTHPRSPPPILPPHPRRAASQGPQGSG